MAIEVLTDASLVINSVDLSDHGNQVSLDLGQDTPEITAFGDTYHVHVGGGLKTVALSITMYGDEAASEVGQTLNTIFAAGAAITIVIKAKSDAVSVTNPSWTGSFILSGYPAVTGSVGEVPSITTTWMPAGAITRATA